jgi:myo-inositol 2-dehydrogenase / D-chiro-inositol 1-dehydrogenase
MSEPNVAASSTATDRRSFIKQSAALAASAAWLDATSGAAAETQADAPKQNAFSRKIKLGLIGCGGRGPWLCDFFQKHGGYEIYAVADYFADLADRAGQRFGVDKSRRFSGGLSAYKRLLDSGVEAVAVVNVPRFHAEHGYAAIEAGCHVYAAKPVAIDVPRAMKVQAAGKLATQKKLCYLVDYQMGTDPVNIEVVKRVHEGGLGQLMHIDSIGFSPPWGESPARTIEERLRSGCWGSTIALSGDVITENTVHSINAVLWLVGRRPASAIGRTRLCRKNPRGDYREIYLVTYEFDDGLLWTHRCQSLNNQLDWALNLNAFGDVATALVSYRGKSYLKGGPKHYGGGTVESLYDQGAIRNIATFYKNIVEGHFDNPTVQQAVDDSLTAALGREAATRRRELSMDDLIKENKELELDLSSVKA